ncbi:hypothetical protein PTKIN_Ptkin03bG0205500 [Pterospermum kingtungense]
MRERSSPFQRRGLELGRQQRWPSPSERKQRREQPLEKPWREPLLLLKSFKRQKQTFWLF